MNAIDLLESQHREVAKLFPRIEKAASPAAKEALFAEIADKLAVHAAIEEHHFYPAVKAKRTEDILLEALEEHLGIKRVLADLLETEASDPEDASTRRSRSSRSRSSITSARRRTISSRRSGSSSRRTTWRRSGRR